MKKYVLHRFLQLIPILLGITFLSFAMMRLAGSDVVTQMYQNRGTEVSQEIIDAKRAELGLDQPFLIQYGRWLGGMLTGDMGESYMTGKPVFPTFLSKLPATLLLTALSIILTLLMQLLSIKLQLLPVISDGVTLKSAWMPALTLAVSMSAKYMRQVRAAVLEEWNKDYVQGARARGVRSRVILWKNVMKSSMLTIITLLALSIGNLLGGTAIIESIFMWDGVGKLAVDAITMRDYPVIQAYVVWMAIIYVLVNLVTDLLYHRLDPRIRLGVTKG